MRRSSEGLSWLLRIEFWTYLLAYESHLSIIPSVSFSRQLVGILANNYPYMFLGDPAMTV
jgi:hypothetical protein